MYRTRRRTSAAGGRAERHAVHPINGTTTQFLYDGDALVGEYPATGNTPLRRYVYGDGTDVPLIWYEGGAVSTSTANFLIADRQGTIAAVGNSSGAVTANYTYDPYGAPNAWGVVGTAPRFRYTSQAAIPEAQLYYYKARVYDPVAGRFLQTDPVGYGPDVNWYVYAHNDPVNGGDPSGEEPCTGTHIVGVTCVQSSSSVQSSGKVAAGSTQNGPGSLPAPGGNATNSGTLAGIEAGINTLGKKLGDFVSGTGSWVAGAAKELGDCALDPGCGGPILVELGITTRAASFVGDAVEGANAVTISQASATLPEGMTQSEFGKLAGFAQGQINSSHASTAATPEIINNLRSAGVSRLTIESFQRFYAGLARETPSNLAAVHRAALLSNILKAMK